MSEAARRDVFQAIADPTRRRIIEIVSKETLNIITIASKLKMSQPAISQQIKILSECGLVEIETVGRERRCTILSKNLIPAFLWLEQYHKQWTDRVNSFEEYINSIKPKNKKPRKR